MCNELAGIRPGQQEEREKSGWIGRREGEVEGWRGEGVEGWRGGGLEGRRRGREDREKEQN